MRTSIYFFHACLQLKGHFHSETTAVLTGHRLMRRGGGGGGAGEHSAPPPSHKTKNRDLFNSGKIRAIFGQNPGNIRAKFGQDFFLFCFVFIFFFFFFFYLFFPLKICCPVTCRISRTPTPTLGYKFTFGGTGRIIVHVRGPPPPPPPSSKVRFQGWQSFRYGFVEVCPPPPKKWTGSICPCHRV